MTDKVALSPFPMHLPVLFKFSFEVAHTCDSVWFYWIRCAVLDRIMFLVNALILGGMAVAEHTQLIAFRFYTALLFGD